METDAFCAPAFVGPSRDRLRLGRWKADALSSDSNKSKSNPKGNSSEAKRGSGKGSGGSSPASSPTTSSNGLTWGREESLDSPATSAPPSPTPDSSNAGVGLSRSSGRGGGAFGVVEQLQGAALASGGLWAFDPPREDEALVSAPEASDRPTATVALAPDLAGRAALV